MPYFIESRDGQFCVMKGTKADPQGVEKCHDTPEEAKAHLKALYANVEGARDRSEQEKAGTDVVSTSNLPHGVGSPLSGATADADDGKPKCICPRCGRKSSKSAETCKLQDCPVCEIPMYEMEDEVVDKATWTAAYVNSLPDSSFLHVESGGEKDDEGKTTPRSLRHLPYKDADGKIDLPHLRNAASRLGQPGTGTGEDGWLTAELRKRLQARVQRLLAGEKDETSKFVAYKTADGIWRWLAISSIALEDKEKEIVSEKAYDDAIRYARDNNTFGELDIVHVDGTEVGDCDMMARLNFMLVEGGTWRTTPQAVRVREKIADDSEHWGVSIKFRYDPTQFNGKVYQGGIQILKRSILPRSMAASYGTAIAVLGGEKKMAIDEQAKAVLLTLGYQEAEIAELAEKQKGMEPHVKSKFKEKVTAFFADLFGEPQATEPEVAESVMEAPATPSVEVKAEEATEEKANAPTSEETAAQLGQATATLIVPIMEKAIRDAVQPLQAEITALQTRLMQTEKSVEDRVVEKLAALPPVAKVQPTFVAPTETGLVTQKQGAAPSEAKVFVEAVADLVKKAYESGELKLQV